MKKLTMILLLGIFTSQVLLAGEEASKSSAKSRNMAFSFNPLQLLFLTLSGNYAVGVSDKIALVIPLNIMYVSGDVTYDRSNGSSASSSYLLNLGSGLGSRFYLSGHAFEDGLYLQPGFGLGWTSLGGQANTYSLQGYAMLGYSWVWDSGFMLNLALGGQYLYMGVNAKSNKDIFALHGFLPSGEFSLGYAW